MAEWHAQLKAEEDFKHLVVHRAGSRPQPQIIQIYRTKLRNRGT
jgi:hypothetical protein